MSIERQVVLAGSRMGRVWLHTVGLAYDHKLAWHWKGIYREIRGI
jgi:hypothetical protein